MSFFLLSIQIESKAAHFIILNKVRKLHLHFVLFPMTFCFFLHLVGVLAKVQVVVKLNQWL